MLQDSIKKSLEYVDASNTAATGKAIDVTFRPAPPHHRVPPRIPEPLVCRRGQKNGMGRPLLFPASPPPPDGVSSITSTYWNPTGTIEEATRLGTKGAAPICAEAYNEASWEIMGGMIARMQGAAQGLSAAEIQDLTDEFSLITPEYQDVHTHEGSNLDCSSPSPLDPQLTCVLWPARRAGVLGDADFCESVEPLQSTCLESGHGG